MILRILLSLLFISIINIAMADKVEIKLEGIDDELLANVKASLSILNEINYELEPIRIEQLFFMGEKEISDALKPYGYYKSKVKSNKKQISKNKWLITYQIKKGAPIKVTKLDIQIFGDGKVDKNFTTLIEHYLHKQQEKILIQSEYEQLKENLLITANEKGYFQAYFVQAEILISLKKNEAEINLHFDTKTRSKFGKVSFSENPLNNIFLNRFIPFKEGDDYDIHELQLLQQGLSTNPNFGIVTVLPVVKDAEDLIPITVDLQIKKPTVLTTGIGYGTDTGIRALLGFQHRRINSFGHYIENRYQVSEYRNNYAIIYNIPGKNPISENYSINASYLYDSPPKHKTSSKTKQIGFRYQIHHPDSNWSHSYNLHYQKESFHNEKESERARLLMPSYALQWRTTNSDLFPTRGTRINFDTRFADNWLISSTSFIQATLGIKQITTPWKNARTIIRAKTGATIEDKFKNLPTSLRFYAGGDNSVRGYAFQSLGPKKTDEQGRNIVIGGRYLLEGSFELEQAISEKWRLAAFYDAGNAINSFNHSLKKGAGGGIRWESPIGLVRLDVALALSETNKPWRIHFNVGSEL